jgi:hypothetical protein
VDGRVVRAVEAALGDVIVGPVGEEAVRVLRVSKKVKLIIYYFHSSLSLFILFLIFLNLFSILFYYFFKFNNIFFLNKQLNYWRTKAEAPKTEKKQPDKIGAGHDFGVEEALVEDQVLDTTTPTRLFLRRLNNFLLLGDMQQVVFEQVVGVDHRHVRVQEQGPVHGGPIRAEPLDEGAVAAKHELI